MHFSAFGLMKHMAGSQHVVDLFLSGHYSTVD